MLLKIKLESHGKSISDAHADQIILIHHEFMQSHAKTTQM